MGKVSSSDEDKRVAVPQVNEVENWFAVSQRLNAVRIQDL